MSRHFWTPLVAVMAIFWGIAVIGCRHHLSVLIPALGICLLILGIGILVVYLVAGRRS